MNHSFLPSDDELPTWLHTALLILVVSPFAVPLVWLGLGAIASGHLEPLSGPDMGQTFFGPLPLDGKPARVAGLSLLLFGAYFATLAWRFSRFADASTSARWLPWVLLAASIAVSIGVGRPD